MARPAVSRASVWSWVVYDLANTIFALGVVGRYFPEWLTEAGQADSSLALVEALAGAIVIFLAPWAGARGDSRGTRVPTLRLTTLVAVGATAFLAVGPFPLTMTLLLVALIAFNVGAVAYDSLLVDVSTPDNRGRISGLGVGIGYLGSVLGLGIGLLTLEVLGWSYAATFRALALGFLIFALPAFFFIKERGGVDGRPMPGIGDVVARMAESWRAARGYPGVVRFLVGRFLYTDAINTLIGGFLTIFVIQELGFEGSLVTGLLMLAIVGAIIGAIGAGRLVSPVGPLRLLRWVLVVWMVAIASGVAAAITGNTGLAWLIGALGGLALGATWASDRVVMTRISPPRRLGQFYGLYATVGRFATILGPLVWALIVDVLDLGRTVAMTALIVFIAIGWWVLRRVDDSERSWPPEDLQILNENPAPQI